MMVAAVAALLGCAGQNSGVNLSSGGSGPGYSLSSSAHMIDKNSNLVESVSSTEVRFTKVVSLHVGDVLIGNYGKGFYRKVLSSSTVNGKTVAKVGPAALSDGYTSMTVAKVPWNGNSLGAVKPTNPNLGASWVTGSDGTNSKLRLDFGSRGLPLQVDSQTGITGSLDFEVNPVWNPVFGTDSSGYKKLVKFEIGANPKFSGRLQITRTYSGSFSYISNPAFIDQDLEPITNGGVWIVPHIKVYSKLDGQANFALGAGVGADSQGSALVTWTSGRGVGTVLSGSYTGLTDVTTAKGTFSFDARALEADVTFNLWDIGGPTVGIFVGAQGDGALVVDTLAGNHIHAKAGAGLYVSVGFDASDWLKKLFAEITESEPNGVLSLRKDFNVLGKTFEKDFPLSGLGAVQVGDNGPAADDVFEVTVDGAVVGSTQKGQTNVFPIYDLSPGNHTLSVKTTDDGANGADTGTLEIVLSHGVKFADGSTVYSGDVSLGDSVTFTIQVPKDAAKWLNEPTAIRHFAHRYRGS